MGTYINPPGETKEEWLHREADIITSPAFPADEGITLVCLVVNPGFTAAALIGNERDWMEFNEPSDTRPKLWFEVATRKLTEVI